MRSQVKCKRGNSEMGTEFPKAYSQLENKEIKGDTRPSSERQEDS